MYTVYFMLNTPPPLPILEVAKWGGGCFARCEKKDDIFQSCSFYGLDKSQKFWYLNRGKGGLARCIPNLRIWP